MNIKKEADKGKSLFFISVTDEEESNNRKYSDLVYNLCYSVIFEDNDLKKLIDLNQFQRHDMKNMGNIKSSLNECLIKSDIFIVLLDCFDNSYNPNVWFELGVVATYQKPVILIARENTKIPFDVNEINTVRISNAFIDKANLPLQYNMTTTKYQKIIKDRSLSDFIFQFSEKFTVLLRNSLIMGSPFSTWFDQYDVQDLGYYSVRDLFTRSGIMNLLENPDVRAEYIPGERAAFEALITEVSKAKKSLRTTRFANQSIVTGHRNNNDIHEEFMEALHLASSKVSRCDRIICNNHPLKWNDILNVLSKSTSNMRVFVRQSQYDIGFELVIVDEKIAFIHFYQLDIHGDENKNGDTYRHEVEVINSTLKIRGESVCKKLANIFDRLHHRDFDTNCKDPSRTLLGIPRERDLDDNERLRGVFQLNNYKKYTTDDLVLHSKRNEAIEMFINAFQTWDFSNSEDKKNLAIGLCLIDSNFDQNLESYIADMQVVNEIRQEAEKYKKEIQETK